MDGSYFRLNGNEAGWHEKDVTTAPAKINKKDEKAHQTPAAQK